ncbi:MAG: glycosyltransferase [Planctomycetia bacterium]|nr:glycosyltransferase [Planctomycetia bacterium]
MHILWLKSDYVDPPDTGGKLRTYHLLKNLRQWCDVTYVSVCTPREANGQPKATPWASRIVTFPREEERKAGAAFYAKVLARAFSTKPFVVQKYASREIRDCQRGLCGAQNGSATHDQDTVVVCDFLEMSGNVDWSLPWPKVLFQHNVESVIWRRYFENESNPLKRAYFWYEQARLRRFERAACNRFDLVLAVSPQDRDVFRRDLGVRTPVDVIDTGVDVDYFETLRGAAPVPGRLLFLGSLDWMPNIDGLHWFVREVYPRIKSRHPATSLDVVGRRPVASIDKLAASDSSIHVHADVPDVRPHLAAADVFVVPLRIGSGTRLKIFEGMAAGRPAVSTTIGAEGLPVENGRHILLADAAEAFADSVVSLLENPPRKHEMAEEAFRFVAQNHGWQSVSRKFYEQCRTLSLQTRPELKP